MLTTYERPLVLRYLANAVSRLHRDSPEAGKLMDWVSENTDLLSLSASAVELCRERPRRRKSKSGFSRSEWSELRDHLLQGNRTEAGRVRADRLTVRLRSLVREMRLSRTDLATLEVLLRECLGYSYM